MFTKEERSTFPYWYAHWSALQMVALTNRIWDPSMIFHDWYKPWMKLVCSYDTVQHFHRYHSRHHIEYFVRHPYDIDGFDFIEHLCDIACSRYTKASAQMTARETVPHEVEKMKKLGIPQSTINEYQDRMYAILDSLGGDL